MKEPRNDFAPPPPPPENARDSGAQNAPRLIFPSPTDSLHGFTTSKQFNNDSASCVRELIQNSLDAALIGAKEKTAEVRFSIKNVPIDKIPGMAAYRRAFDSAKAMNTNSQANNVVKGIERVLKQKEVSVLYVADNGTGFTDAQLKAMLSVSISDKPEGASGSFGIGHLTAFALTRLNYIFYGGVLKEHMSSAGHAILASHKGEQGQPCSKDGYYVCDFDINQMEDRFVFGDEGDVPLVLREDMDRIRKDWKHGALVAIVGFNHFEEGDDDEGGQKGESAAEIILQEVALNFFVAIHEGWLKVTIEEDGKPPCSVDKNDLLLVLNKKKEERNSKRTGFPSGSRVWNACETHRSGVEHIAKTSEGDVRILLREGGNEGQKIAVCRNGMWITDKVPCLTGHFGAKVNFDALLLVNSSDIGKANAEDKCKVHDALRLAEPPLHNEIKLKNILADEERARARKILQEIRDNLKEWISDKGEEEGDIDDILQIEGSGQAIGGKESSPSSSIGGMDPRGSGGRTGSGKGSGGKGTTLKVRPGKAPAVRASGRQTSSGVLDAVLIPQENCEDVEMWLSLDGGEDDTCGGGELKQYVTINKISVGEIQTTGDITSVRLGRWMAGEKINIKVEYTPPVTQQEYALNFAFARRKAKVAQRAEEDKNV